MKQSLRSQPLKLAAIDIPFDLRILGSRFVAGKPITKGRKLTLTESLYSLFNGFYCTPISGMFINTDEHGRKKMNTDHGIGAYL